MHRAFSITNKIIVSVLLLTSITLARVPTEGLVAWYPFTGSANDSSGNEQHGTTYNVQLTSDRFSNANSAYRFEGFDSSYIIANGSDSLPKDDTPKSISLWFNKTDTINQYAIMAGFGEGPVAHRNFQIGYRYEVFCINGFSAQYDWNTPVSFAPYTDGKWHHFVGLYDGNETAIYLDGVKRASTTTKTYPTGTDFIVIGTEIDLVSWNYTGSLDDVAIYNRALTPADIASIYNYNNFGITLIEIPDTTNRRPIFSWYTKPGSPTYTISIDTSYMFNNPMVVLPVSDTMFQPGFDLPIDTIYWKVTIGDTQTSGISSFIILDPYAPITIPFVPYYIYNRKPTFKWYKIDGATNYTIDLSLNMNFTDIISTMPTSDTTYTPLADLPVDTIYWQVKSDLSTTYSRVEMVLILSDSIPELYRFDGATVDTYRPTFKWKPVTGAATYQIKIDSLSTFPSPIVMTPVSDTTFPLPVDIIGKILFWKVSSNLKPDYFSPHDSLKTKDSTSIIVNPDLNQSNNSLVIQPVSRNLVKISIRFNKTYNDAVINIYSITGRQVKRIKTKFTDNKQSVLWNCTDNNGRKVPAGVYVIQFKAEGFNAVGKVHLAY